MVMPRLERCTAEGVTFWTDPHLAASGLVVAFTERTGGVSEAPFDSLNLAAHVGDEPEAVDQNRSRLMGALGIHGLRERLVTAEQTHGDHVAQVADADAGSGAFAASAGDVPFQAPIVSADGLVTTSANVPLLLLFADCVPVVLVVDDPVPGVAVIHAGWRGALARIPQKGAAALIRQTGATPSQVRAYLGPHIGKCCYKVSTTLSTRFHQTFDTISAVEETLDLAEAVRVSLCDAGLSPEMIVELGSCTSDSTDRFFSYRANDVTGRHGALALITED